MTLRWGLFARLAAIVALFLFCVQLLLVGLYVRGRSGGDDTGYRFPLPDRVVAMVQLVETGDDRRAVLTALNSDDIVVFVSPAPIAEFEAEEFRLPKVEALFTDYRGYLGERRFAAFIDAPDGVDGSVIRRADRSLFSRYPLRVAVALRTGGTLVMESRDDLVTKVYALPIGFFAGVLSVIGAAIVLLALHRETRPLRVLSQAMRRFGADGAPVAVRAAGAADLRRLIADFNAMQVRISDLVRERTVMLGALGHDLRTCLARLRLRADLLPAGDDRDRIIGDIDRMAEVAQNCLALGRGSGRGAPRDVIDLTDEVSRLIADRPGATLLADADTGIRALFDAVSFRRLLGNLVDNALTFGTRCEIGVAARGDTAIVTVSDDGPGIPAENREAVFEAFYRADAARTLDRQGSGLGLAIARMLAERNGATITLSVSRFGGLCAMVAAELGPPPPPT